MSNFLSKIKDLISGQPWSVKQPEPVVEQPAQSAAESRDNLGQIPRKINKLGANLIHSFESLELEAYPDPGSDLGKVCTSKGLHMRSYRKIVGWEKLDGGPWTIGWGHTGKMPDGTAVGPGKKITRDQADALFEEDVASFEAGVARLVKVAITDNQFAALVSFAYNVGLDESWAPGKPVRGLKSSTLLRKLNAGDYAAAAECFLDWAKVKNKRTGEVTLLKGLARRRGAERDLFLRAD